MLMLLGRSGPIWAPSEGLMPRTRYAEPPLPGTPLRPPMSTSPSPSSSLVHLSPEPNYGHSTLSWLRMSTWWKTGWGRCESALRDSVSDPTGRDIRTPG